MAESRTLILIKPDAFERGLTGEILARFERKGLRIADLRLIEATVEIANVHYEEHVEKPFFGELVEFITGGAAGRRDPRGPRGGRGRATGDRRDRSRSRQRPARSAATSASRSRSTWSTARTPIESAEREIGIWFGLSRNGRSSRRARRAGARSSPTSESPSSRWPPTSTS